LTIGVGGLIQLAGEDAQLGGDDVDRLACLAETAAAQVGVQRHVVDVGLDRLDVADRLEQLGGGVERRLADLVGLLRGGRPA
jgi:hypothetical protein